MKRIIIGLTIILGGAAVLALILYSVLVDRDFIFNMYGKFKSVFFKGSEIEKVEPAPPQAKEGNADKDNEAEPSTVPPRKVIIGNPNPTVVPVPEDPSAMNEDPGESRPLVQKTSVKDTLSRMALSFSERFGSYSNHSNFSNIETLKVFMTKRMQKWADTYVEQAKEASGGQGIYYGMTTKAIAADLEEFDEDVGTAKLLVKTRRIEAVGDTENKSQAFSQDIEIYFVKENNIWKIDGAYWLN